ncbi:hypothetical protein HMPREF1613_05209 [Escherichia coli 908616]|nr:hypothetical protein HMPREF9552_03985 [Escherichia coli MS 198-1]ESD27679.1 hypothetical protein HMPREF1600_02050 [Escherichia coli 907715]ESD54724.1 hypothetical protein HMPREF1605_02272 [Escherichia coli 908521]ESD56821.1 hypothetical protein HMPREF1606_02511 [Escherichia coli 908522]ESD81839.1 hypothetical protein HMPREF1613_05209 [Escherichia coli 908616]ESD92971.1 hypothetical protein HMPREF1612_01405 [Escherichia coli 908585]KXG92766.1 hypothetical protein HMPREF3040_04388 [Escherich
MFIALINKQHAIATTFSQAVEQAIAAAIAVVRRNQQIARFQKDGRYQVNRGHAGISKYGTGTAFQFCQRTLNHIARWVATTRVIMRARFIKSGKVIGAGKMDRWDNATILFVVI